MLLHAAYAVLAEVGVMGGNGGEEFDTHWIR
jgi:hypothetical protein